MSLLVLYAMKFVGVPYIWGGSSPLMGFDCSGLVQECLSSIGIDPPGDQTAQGLYNELSKKAWRSQLAEDSILFFGKSRFEISHVAIAVSDKLMIEAGGGGSKTITVEDAIKQEAYVRIRPIKRRKDLVAVLMPEY